MDLTAVLAHELRSPLALIHARMQLLQETLEAEGRGAEADACRRSVRDLRRLMRLLEFFLAAAQPWSPQPVALAAVARRAVQAVEDMPEASGVRVVVEGPADLVVRGSARGLQQAVFNLLLNAVQACGSGGTVRLVLEPQGDAVLVTVADDGPGFPPAVLRRPFVAYRTGHEGGTGLGLVICKWIVDRHGGRMAIANAGGAVVRLALPALRGDA